MGMKHEWQKIYCNQNCNKQCGGPGGIEPATLGTGGRCFNHYAVELGKSSAQCVVYGVQCAVWSVEYVGHNV